MADNFFLDNQDLQFHLDKLDLREVLELKEKGYSYHQEYPTAPRNYEDAKDNYRLLAGSFQRCRISASSDRRRLGLAESTRSAGVRGIPRGCRAGY